MTEVLARTESKASEIGLVFLMGGFGTSQYHSEPGCVVQV